METVISQHRKGTGILEGGRVLTECDFLPATGDPLPTRGETETQARVTWGVTFHPSAKSLLPSCHFKTISTRTPFVQVMREDRTPATKGGQVQHSLHFYWSFKKRAKQERKWEMTGKENTTRNRRGKWNVSRAWSEPPLTPDAPRHRWAQKVHTG